MLLVLLLSAMPAALHLFSFLLLPVLNLTPSLLCVSVQVCRHYLELLLAESALPVPRWPLPGFFFAFVQTPHKAAWVILEAPSCQAQRPLAAPMELPPFHPLNLISTNSLGARRSTSSSPLLSRDSTSIWWLSAHPRTRHFYGRLEHSSFLTLLFLLISDALSGLSDNVHLL